MSVREPHIHHLDLENGPSNGPLGLLRTRTLPAQTDAGKIAATVVSAVGEFDLSNAAQLRELLLCELCKVSVVVLDLSGTTFIDSTVLGALIAARRRAGLVGGALRLAGPTRNVTKVLQLTALDRVFSIYDDTEAALAAPHASP